MLIAHDFRRNLRQRGSDGMEGLAMDMESYLARVLTDEAHAHRLRCRHLPPMRDGEAERLKAAFLATRHITDCPTRFAVPTQQASLPMQRGH